jgi:hypothetical protein
MAIEAARLYVSVGAQIDGAVAGLATVDKATRNLAAKASPVITPQVDTSKATGALAGLKAKIAGLSPGGAGLLGGLVGAGSFMAVTAVTSAVAGLAAGMIGGASAMEKYTVQFGVLLGSTQAAQRRMAELIDFAKTTPFELPEVVAASKTLEVFTKGALATGEGLRLVGDIASGTGMAFDEASMWVGRLYDALENGRPIGEAAMRLQEVGALSGESRAKLEALAASVKSGAVSGTAAWATAAGEFSRYTGMMAKQSETLEGKTSNLADAFNQMLTKAGTMALPALKGGVDILIAALDDLSAAATFADEILTKWGGKRPVGVTGPSVMGIDTGSAVEDLQKKMFAHPPAGLGPNMWDIMAEQAATGAALVAFRAGERLASAAPEIAAAAQTMVDPLAEEMGKAVDRATEIAARTPAEMATALLSDVTSWRSALESLNTVLATSMTKGAKVGFLLAALTGTAIKEGLASSKPEVVAETKATAKVLMDSLIALQGPSWVAGYNFGNAAVQGMAKGLEGMNATMGRGGGGFAQDAADKAAGIAASTTGSAARSGAAAYVAFVKSMDIAVNTGGGAAKVVETALEKAARVADEKLDKIRALFDRFKTYLAAWPRMTAAGITAALDKVLRELSTVWAKLSAGDKVSAIEQAGSEIIRREKVAQLPPAVQGVYAEIDAFGQQMKGIIAAIDKAKPGAAREALLGQAATLQAEILRHTEAAQTMISTYEEIDSLLAEKAKLQKEAAAATSDSDLQSVVDNIAEVQAEIDRKSAEIAKLAGGAPTVTPGASAAGTASASPTMTPATVAGAVAAGAVAAGGGGTLIVQIGADIIARITDEMLFVRGSLTTIPVP